MDGADAATIAIEIEAVHLAISAFFGIHFAALGVFAADEAIILRAIEADSLRVQRRKCLGHLAANVDADRRVRAFAGVVEVAANPAVGFVFGRIAGGLPNFSG